MGTGPALLPHGSGASGLHALGLQPVPPGMALGVVVRVAACGQLKGLVNEGVQAKPATPGHAH